MNKLYVNAVIPLLCIMQPIYAGQALHKPPCLKNDVGYINYQYEMVINNYGTCKNGKEVVIISKKVKLLQAESWPGFMRSKDFKDLAKCK